MNKTPPPSPTSPASSSSPLSDSRDEWQDVSRKTLDADRPEAVASRHSRSSRTARENLADLCDPGSFVEYGQLAVAAQRQRRSLEELRSKTPADGVITGVAKINGDQVGEHRSSTAVIINDYTVLAGSQGHYHHQKLDRILQLAERQSLPVVMYTEGGGGRPGDTDVITRIAGLNIPSFSLWAGLSGKVPRIAVNHGYCFAGNAALFGCADVRIATRESWIGMAGPAMIEGGGLGQFKPRDIGPAENQAAIGVVDILATDESDATRLARQTLSCFQGGVSEFIAPDQGGLWNLLPADRRYSYHIRQIIETLADEGSWLELGQTFGPAIITGFLRINGQPVGLLANDCRVLGGAIDAQAATAAARFMRLCSRYGIALISLCDTPGFMVGPSSEEEAAVHHMSDLFVAGAGLQVPLVTIFIRKAYGLGAMAMAGGSFVTPVYAASWPSGEFGAMGLEGAVRLGFRKELEAETDPARRQALFDGLLSEMYQKGKAIEAATHLEIDAVIDPAETRQVIAQTLSTHWNQT